MPTPTYTPLATVTLGSSASSVTFSSIPATYRDLILVVSAPNTTTDTGIRTRFNGDTGSNYTVVSMRGTGSITQSTSGTNTFANIVDSFVSSGYIGIGQIMDYSATDKHKTILVRKGAAFEDVGALANRWANTEAITTIELSPNLNQFAIGSTFNLFGVIA